MAVKYITAEEFELQTCSVQETPASLSGSNRWYLPAAANETLSRVLVIANLSKDYGALSKGEDSVASVVRRIEAGLPAESFDRLKDFMGLSREALTKIVHIAPRTLARRKRLKIDESERLFRLGAAFQRAVEVLGSQEAAHNWFITPQLALDNITPLEFCKTDLGVREVEDLLGRIEHGVFS